MSGTPASSNRATPASDEATVESDAVASLPVIETSHPPPRHMRQQNSARSLNSTGSAAAADASKKARLTIDRNDWKNALTRVFVKRKAETFYLIQFSVRVVAPVSRDSQVIKPKGGLVGLAHAFLPSDSDGFATEILKEASDDDSFLVIKV